MNATITKQSKKAEVTFVSKERVILLPESLNRQDGRQQQWWAWLLQKGGRLPAWGPPTPGPQGPAPPHQRLDCPWLPLRTWSSAHDVVGKDRRSGRKIRGGGPEGRPNKRCSNSSVTRDGVILNTRRSFGSLGGEGQWGEVPEEAEPRWLERLGEPGAPVQGTRVPESPLWVGSMHPRQPSHRSLVGQDTDA